MQKGVKSKCTSTSHNVLLDNAKNRINDLQERFINLQTARMEGRISDVAMLEEQVNQSLREWKAELDTPSPASSFLGGSLGAFSDDISRLLQLCEEEDDATSALAEQPVLKVEPHGQKENIGNFTALDDDFFPDNDTQVHSFQGFDQCNTTSLPLQSTVVGNSDMTELLGCEEFCLDADFVNGLSLGSDDKIEFTGRPENLPISPPPSAFMGPKCALWDCMRPANGSEWSQDYCTEAHAILALNEDPPGMTPVLRPNGIGLKDNILFNALTAKILGKNVGIPQCEGAATKQCPWNASELFDLALLEGETIREWLFFDKPRRAFESGSRKQRSLPDYNGRGWHESRKQVMKELGGLKRSYYMDPQPPGCHEWHLYEYELSNSNACALYRLELKHVDEKKTHKVKVSKDSLADLQKKMGRLTADSIAENSPPSKGKTKADKKTAAGNNLAQEHKTSPAQTLGHDSVQSSSKLL